jgi:hypothetical protein
MIGPSEYLRLALDPLRLRVLGHAASGEVDPEALADELGVKPRAVNEAIGRLRAAGLLTPELALDVSELRRIASELPQAPPIAAQITGKGTWSADEAEILGRFFSGARLREIPSGRAKRLVVLERLAMEFEPGVRYQEAEVNFTLQMFHRDYAALRRYLVDEDLMTRADGVYWRTGGRYEAGSGVVEPEPT